MTCASLKQEAGHSKPGALGHPRGMGWGGRRERVQDEGHMCTRDGFMLMYGKNHHNIVK